jgi:beta-N-acetylhexosaminidase
MIDRRTFLAGHVALGIAGILSPSYARARSRSSSGQLLISGFRGTRRSDPEVDTVRRYIQQGEVAGVMLLRRNIRSPEQLEQLVSAFREAAPKLRPIISIDQEGGAVARVGAHNGFKNWGSAADIAQSGRSNDEIIEYYSVRARELSEVGVNLNFGPVVDLNLNPFNPIIGSKGRSYGSDVETVIRFAELFVRAHRSAGVKTCLKHFPGHGSSTEDSHKGTADVSRTWSAAEIAPFERLVRAGLADTIMNSHVLHRYLSDEPWVPTSLSKAAVDELRDGLKFVGPIITDDMQMNAVTDIFSTSDAAIAAINSGNSLLIYSNYDRSQKISVVQDVAASISKALDDGHIAPASFEKKVELIKAFRSSL